MWWLSLLNAVEKTLLFSLFVQLSRDEGKKYWISGEQLTNHWLNGRVTTVILTWPERTHPNPALRRINVKHICTYIHRRRSRVTRLRRELALAIERELKSHLTGFSLAYFSLSRSPLGQDKENTSVTNVSLIPLGVTFCLFAALTSASCAPKERFL